MNRERAETHLRQLAEAELRRAAALPAGSIPGRWNTARLALVAPALSLSTLRTMAARDKSRPRPQHGTHPAGAATSVVADSAGRQGDPDPR